MAIVANCTNSILKPALLVTIVVALLGTVACNSKSSARTGDSQDSGAPPSGAHIDVMCIGDRINAPTEPFHYSFKYSGAPAAQQKEADITPQIMDITITGPSGSHSYHGVRSDETSWNNAVLDLSSLNITVMSARLDSLNGGSAIQSQGAENMNGYQTTKYAIDTGRASAKDKQTWEALFGKGSYERGTVWAPADGCVVKALVDEGVWQSDGSIEKRHFEMARIKK